MLTDVPRSPTAALSAALLLEALEGADPARACVAAINADLGGSTSAFYQPPTDEYPGYLIADNAQTSVVAISGTSTLTQGLLLVASYAAGIGDPPTRPANFYLRQVASAILSDIAAGRGGKQPNLVIVGHSLGGAVAVVLASLLPGTQPSRPIRVITLGAPKPGSYVFAAQASGMNLGRWFSIDDPVPLVMPTAADDLALALVYPLPSLLRFGWFAQPAGGVQVDATGHCQPATLPAQASVGSVANLASWLLTLVAQTNSPHNLAAYVGRFSIAVELLGVAANAPIRGGSAEDPSASSEGSQSAAAKAARDALAAQEADQHAGGSWGTIPDEWLPRAVRIGRVYAVTSNDTVLCVSSRPKSARAIAAALRSAVRHLQLCGLVEVTAVNAWWQTLLGAAQVASNGWTPTLKSELEVPQSAR